MDTQDPVLAHLVERVDSARVHQTPLEIRGGMPTQRAEQANIPIHVMPNGDTAGARGAALEALKLARQSGLA